MTDRTDGKPFETSGELDVALELLGDETRRYLLYFLRENEECSLDDLADVLTGWEAVRDEHATGTPAERSRLAVELYHKHLPKLDDAEVLAFDREAKVISLSGLSPPFDRLLDATMALEPDLTPESVATLET